MLRAASSSSAICSRLVSARHRQLGIAKVVGGCTKNAGGTNSRRLLSFESFLKRNDDNVKSATTATAKPTTKSSGSGNNNTNNTAHQNHQSKDKDNQRPPRDFSGLHESSTSPPRGFRSLSNHNNNARSTGGGSSASSARNNGGHQQQYQSANNSQRSSWRRPETNSQTPQQQQPNSISNNNNNSKPSIPSWQQQRRQQQERWSRQTTTTTTAQQPHSSYETNANNRQQESSSSTKAATATITRPSGVGDISDISQLRNTFMKNRSNKQQQQLKQQQQKQQPSLTSSWRSSRSGQQTTNDGLMQPGRTADFLSSRTAALSQSTSSVPKAASSAAASVDAVARKAGVGAKWTPSMYKKKTPPPPPPPPPPSTPSISPSSLKPLSSSSLFTRNNNDHRIPHIPPLRPITPLSKSKIGNNNNNTTTSSSSQFLAASSQQPTAGATTTNDIPPPPAVKSIEQIMKDNALQRKHTMEQTYLNAGQRIPYNADEYGRSQGRPPPKENGGGGNGKPGWRQNAASAGGGRYQNQRGGGYQNQRGGGYQNQRQNNQYGQQHQQQRQQQQYKERQRKRIRKQLPRSMPTEVRLPTSSLTLVDLSLLLRVQKRTIVRTLRSLGEQISYTSANQDSYKIDVDTMEYICIELGIDPVKVEGKVNEVEEAEKRAMRQSQSLSRAGDTEDEDGVAKKKKTEEEERYASYPPRSPVVSIMGHVDHGKTTLMDALRRRAVTGVDTPAGGGMKGNDKKKKSKKSSSKKKNEQGSKSRGKGGVNVTDGNVAGTEAGGITQVITAFEVPLPLEDGASSSSDTSDNESTISTVTFLDTPGHAAFKKMRQSGSSATDVIVLVVAADDGVSPQTIEIINMYKNIARAQPQSISLVIAVSKIDKPGIDIDESVMKIENQLMEHEIYTENVLAGGGDEGEFGACQLFPVSGITGEGLDDLVEGLALQSEIMDLRADEMARGEGIVIDARMEKGLGVVADCVIRWGSVAKGDFVVSGVNGGRVKFLNDVGNKPITRARPSQPVRIVGFKTLPKAGDPIVCASSEDEAKELIRVRESELYNEERAEYEEDIELQVMGTAAKQGIMMQKARSEYGYDGLENDNDEAGDSIRIPVVIKADSHGSLEAVRDALVQLGTDSKLDIIIDPVEMSTGVVTSSDVAMARVSEAAIFAFGKVGVADKETKNEAEKDGVSIRQHDIIYRLLEDAKEVFGKYLPVQLVEKIHGKAKVQAVFDVTDAKKQSVSIAGLRVTDGYLFKAKSKGLVDGEEPLSCFYRVLRNGELLSQDVEKLEASSLRKVKEDVDSVRKGEECGLGLTGFNDLKEGDIVECFSIEEKIPAI